VVKVGFAVGRTKSKSCFHDRRPVPSERIGFVCVVPEVSPWPVFHTRLVCRAPLGHSKHPANPLAWPDPDGVSMEMAIPHDGPVIGEASRTVRWVPNDPPTCFLQPVFTFSPTICKV
jgi:hypothetical protein